MSPEVESKLRDRHPWVYENVYFECDDGWFCLLDTLASYIENDISDLKEDIDEYERDLYRPSQIKEKWGGLRFYVDASSERTNIAIQFAESLSFRICEVCGRSGEIRKNCWRKTLCEEHANEHRR